MILSRYGRDNLILNETFSFVIVHGIYGNCHSEAQAGPGSGSSEWVTKYAKSLHSGSRILRFDYAAIQLFSGRRSREAIRNCALKLLRALRARRQHEAKRRLIMFVAHDIGGIIVKDALAAAALDTSSWMEISEMSRILLFIGCPHRCLNSLDMEDRLSPFLFASYDADIAKVRPSASSITGLAAAIIEINGLFVESKIALRSSVISIHARPSQGSINQTKSNYRIKVFDGYCATLGIPLEKRIPEPINDGDNSKLTSYLGTIETDFNTTLSAENLRCERKLLVLASPVYPFQTEQSHNFLTESTEYRAWLRHPGPQILYIHGNHRVREAAEQVFYALSDVAEKESRRTIVLYFSFDKWDVRCDSIRDMLSTFLAQIICHHPRLSSPAETLFTRLDHERGWTEADLVYWFQMFRATGEIEQVLCVINHFDECTKGSRAPFLGNFAYISQTCEQPWKVVVTSHQPSALSKELVGLSSVALDLATLDAGSFNAADVEKDMARLIKLRPELLFQEDMVRQELQHIGELEPLARHIICEQARVKWEWPDETSIQALFGSLEPIPSAGRADHILEQIFERVLRNIPEQATLRRLLSWLLYSVRPLTIWELATVLYLGSDYDRGAHTSPSSSALESLALKVQTWFAGIIDVDQNEVKIRHPRLRSILMGESKKKSASARSTFLWEEVKQTAHFDITSLCLDYLSRPSVQEILDSRFQVTDPETFETPTFADRENLCSYAVQAWTYHFALSSPSPDLSKLLPQPNSANLTQSWARGYWALANPITKRPECLETLFPIFAGLGLLDVVTPRDETDAYQGLLEAASKGQVKTVESLVEGFKSSESMLLDVLVAAASSGDEEMLLSLLDYITSNSTNPGSIVWPPVLIHRAAWMGLGHFAEKLLELNCPADPVIGWAIPLKAPPLYQAARNSHVETVEALLRHNADASFLSKYDRTVFHLAAAQGHPKIVKMLLDEGKADMEALDSLGLSALYLASLWGHHQVVDVLLQMGADPDMGIPKDDSLKTWSPLVTASDDGYQRCVRLLLDGKANPDISGPSGTPLRYAAIRGHMDVCNMLLASGADPNSSLIDPPILSQVINNYDSSENQLEMLDLLLSHNADANAKDSVGTPVLIYATRSSQKEILVRRLLDHGADVNILDSENNSALYHTATELDCKLVKLLLERNAKVNCVSLQGSTPLYQAIPEPQIVRMLLERDADPNLARSSGFTALMFATWFKHTETMELLLQHNAKVNEEYNGTGEDRKGWTALTCGVAYGSEEGVRLLADNGADLKHRADGIPALHLAAKEDTLSAMLEFPSKVDLDQVNDTGSTALHLWDVPFGNFKRLVNAGASLEAQETNAGDTPLTLAAYNDNMDRVKYLLKRGVNINLGSPCDGAALHQACTRMNWDIIKVLVENGADVNQPCDGLAGTPLQAALQAHNVDTPDIMEEVVRYLLEHGADVSAEGGLLRYPIIAAAICATPVLIHLLLEKGAKVDVRDGMGRMPIHKAAYRGIDNFQVFLEAGGDINACDKMGRTALHWAAQPGRDQVVQKTISLLSNKEDIDTPDIDGWTPLCWAARGSNTWLDDRRPGERQDQVKTMKLLLENGANPFVVASVGEQKWTPLKIARFSGQSIEVLELLSRGDVTAGTENAELAEETDKDMSKTANLRTSYCDFCRCVIRGFAYHCTICFDFDFCFKCYPHRRLLHSSPDHIFKQEGPEFEASPKGDNDNDTSSETTSSTDSDSE
ncbi:hypothetical protein QQX98_008763 [Neonectria punicea]|uniref:Nephrocystin 3-like N-terminal domain-containing protein n=1 Tax=Neonectria punicea TaxID=979145 RepID=A0ABR1GUP5_9HYPO